MDKRVHSERNMVEVGALAHFIIYVLVWGRENSIVVPSKNLVNPRVVLGVNYYVNFVELDLNFCEVQDVFMADYCAVKKEENYKKSKTIGNKNSGKKTINCTLK